MLYREAGQCKTTYAADQQIFPIRQDRIGVIALLVVAFIGVPLFASEYWFSAILIPFLIFALAALGLNILTGYAGQLSLGSAAFMAVGAYAAYNFQLRVEGIPILVSFICAGLTAAGVGILFGLPAVRIKGVHLAISTLALQFGFFFVAQRWVAVTNGDNGLQTPQASLFGFVFNTDERLYFLVLPFAVLACVAGSNLFKTRVGRAFVAVRERDYAAEVLGVNVIWTKLLAFAVGAAYAGLFHGLDDVACW